VAAAAAAGHRPVMLLLVGVPGSGGWREGCHSLQQQQPQQGSRRVVLGSA
jgi:hypothetical protein